MSEVVLYSTGCPKCKVLKSKLIAKHIDFVEVEDVDEMGKVGLTSVPWLSVDGKMMDFVNAVRWANEQEVVA